MPAKIAIFASPRLGIASLACPTAALKLRILSRALNGRNSTISNTRAKMLLTTLRISICRLPRLESAETTAPHHAPDDNAAPAL